MNKTFPDIDFYEPYDFVSNNFISIPNFHWITLRRWECINCRPAKRLLKPFFIYRKVNEKCNYKNHVL